jgi:uncharacterized protein YecE (DUF72 family)
MSPELAYVGARVRVGTAGWSIPRQHSAALPGGGSHLERYAGRLSEVEIDSTFYEPHRPTTYARWAACVPSNFSFAVKMPREIMHRLRLQDSGPALERFLGEVASLGSKLGSSSHKASAQLGVRSRAGVFILHARAQAVRGRGRV